MTSLWPTGIIVWVYGAENRKFINVRWNLLYYELSICCLSWIDTSTRIFDPSIYSLKLYYLVENLFKIEFSYIIVNIIFCVQEKSYEMLKLLFTKSQISTMRYLIQRNCKNSANLFQFVINSKGNWQKNQISRFQRLGSKVTKKLNHCFLCRNMTRNHKYTMK